MTRARASLLVPATLPVRLLVALLLAVPANSAVADDTPETSSGLAGRPTLVAQRGAAGEPGLASTRETAKTPISAKASRPSVEPAKSLPDDDYYARRAKSRLVEDATAEAKQASLHLAYPGHNVIMCEAGCYGGSSRIVQFTPRTTTGRPVTSTIQLASSTVDGQKAASDVVTPEAAGPAQPAEIACVAGCYGAQSTSHRSASFGAYRAEPGIAAAEPGLRGRHGAVGADATRWLTTAVKAGSPARLDEPRASAADLRTRKSRKGMASAGAQRARKNPSGEWFQLINADRAPHMR